MNRSGKRVVGDPLASGRTLVPKRDWTNPLKELQTDFRDHGVKTGLKFEVENDRHGGTRSVHR